MIKPVYIISAVRTPIGSFGGSLTSVTTTQLGATAIKGALAKAGVSADKVSEVFMGNVLSAGMGQAPARQAARYAGIPDNVPCTTINKVCASGSKAIMLAAQAIQLGDAEVVVAGGMESMSNVPYYLPAMRNGARLGHSQVVDGIIKDGLWDVYNDYHMGSAAELCAREYKITREMQDAFAIESYKRSQNAVNSGYFKDEIVAVSIPQRKGEAIVVDADEEPFKVNFDKLTTLNPVFEKTGTVTAANASTLNDGASVLILASEEAVKALGLKPIARIVAYADAEQSPEWFTTTPSKSIPAALKKAGMTLQNMDALEINEAFSVVSIANQQILDLDPAKVDVYGGAVALGHPIGMSGARIVGTLINVLGRNHGKYGVTGICNGGGGASSIVLEKL
jgi:acetyl-CoA C-acetyltransferase